MPRSEPFKPNEKNIEDFLKNFLTIPNNQRVYEWEYDNIKNFIYDLFDVYENSNKYETIGTIITYIHPESKSDYLEIFDGQQRIITIILILLSFYKRYNHLHGQLKPLLFIDKNLKSKVKNIKDEYKNLDKIYNIDNSLLLHLHTVNKNDREALYEISNDIFVSPINMLTKNNDFYHCQFCETKKNSWKNLLPAAEHIKSYHKMNCYDSERKSNIYDIYLYIEDLLNEKLYKENDTIDDFYEFIRGIIISVRQYDDFYSVCSAFEKLNNRGVGLKLLTKVKNYFLKELRDHEPYNIWTKWNIYHKNPLIHDDDEFLSMLASSIYNKRITKYGSRSENNKQKLYYNIMKGDDKLENIHLYFSIMDKLINIKNKMLEFNECKLLFNLKHNVSIEIFRILFSIFYIYDNVNLSLVNLFLKYTIRNKGIKTTGVQSYMNKIYTVINDSFENKNDNYYDEIRDILVTNMDSKIKKNKYEKTIIENNYKTNDAVSILKYLEFITNNDINILPETTSLEHIIPSKECKEHGNKLTNKIGNLTLLCGKNSKNGQKGNFSLGCKSYTYKKNIYKKSTFIITRNIYEKYSNFYYEDIMDRTKNISNILNMNTLY